MTQLSIITINDYSNYGNRLQNFALKELLSEYGAVTTVFHDAYPVRRRLGMLKRAAGGMASFQVKLETIRRKKLKDFTRKYVPDTTVSINRYTGLHPSNWQSDYYVLGSDQVWNYLAVPTIKDYKIRFAAFANEGSRVISYAASFGRSGIAEQSADVIRGLSGRVEAISVREDIGKKLIKDITGREATVVLDPTLMIDSEKWSELAASAHIDMSPYVLTYFLGPVEDRWNEWITDYAAANHLNVIDIMSGYDGDAFSVEEFVRLFRDAEWVFTDSYHACCFSIQFKTPFTVLNRLGVSSELSMNSRIETLFRLFQLETRMGQIPSEASFDWIKIGSLLEQHRSESRTWLDRALLSDCVQQNERVHN